MAKDIHNYLRQLTPHSLGQLLDGGIGHRSIRGPGLFIDEDKHVTLLNIQADVGVAVV